MMETRDFGVEIITSTRQLPSQPVLSNGSSLPSHPPLLPPNQHQAARLQQPPTALMAARGLLSG